ncbi:hypothetical protein CFC35_35895 [Streptomyces sp. FBKL.4005]|nr:hypothetical protein CFC35_35895 [Streptomyces sp. FBKL.4005]
MAVFNTVQRAVAVQAALAALLRRGGPEVVLLHSRFRPPEQGRLMDVLKAPLPAAGQIVVSTQVLEAGVDLSSRVLFTEAALVSPVVQRAGRCARAGEFPEGADLLWAPLPPGGGSTRRTPLSSAALTAPTATRGRGALRPGAQAAASPGSSSSGIRKNHRRTKV